MTPKQKEVLINAIKIEDETGVTPSYRELAEATKSQISQIHRIIGELESAGYLVKRLGKHRGIMFTKKGNEYYDKYR